MINSDSDYFCFTINSTVEYSLAHRVRTRSMPVDSLKCIREIGVMLSALNFSLIDLYSLFPLPRCSHIVSGISILKRRKNEIARRRNPICDILADRSNLFISRLKKFHQNAHFHRIEDVDFRQSIHVCLTIADLTQYQVWILKIHRCQTDFVPGVSSAGS